MTDTSKDAVDRLVLAMIRSGTMWAADTLAALAVERDAANARADQARDAALVEALSACKQVAETAREYNIPQMVMGANKCHDDISDLRIHADAILALRDKPASTDFQKRVDDWIIACFGEVIRMDGIDRNHRFLEESLELVQSLGCTKAEAHLLVDYVFNRDAGEPAQEVGGAMNTLASLCTAHGLDMAACGETELARVWTKVESIRAKQAAKPKHSPLPQHTSFKPAPGVTPKIEVKFTWAKGDEEFWVHLKSPDGKSAGFNLGNPKGMIATALLRAIAGGGDE